MLAWLWCQLGSLEVYHGVNPSLSSPNRIQFTFSLVPAGEYIIYSNVTQAASSEFVTNGIAEAYAVLIEADVSVYVKMVFLAKGDQRTGVVGFSSGKFVLPYDASPTVLISYGYAYPPDVAVDRVKLVRVSRLGGS